MIFWEVYSFTGFVRRCARDYLDQLFTAHMGRQSPDAADNASTATPVEIEGGSKKGKWKQAPLQGTCKARWN